MIYAIAPLAAAPAFAQSAAIVTREINRLASATPADRENAIADVVDGAIKVKIAADGRKVNREFLAFRRADVQNGGGSGASGTTSAVSSPLLPAIFGMAFESGALTKSVSGSTVTLKISPAGLVCANGDDARAVAERDPDVCQTFWKRVGVTAAFDTSRDKNAKASPGGALSSFSAAERQFAELTVRAELFNRRQPQSYAAFAAASQQFVNTIATFTAETTPWRQKVTAALTALTRKSDWNGLSVDKREEAIAAALDALVKDLPDPPATARAEWLDALRAQQFADFNRLVVTAEYAYQKPDLTMEAIGDPPIVPAGGRPPSVHTARVIAAKGVGDRNLDLTFNQSVSWFAEVRAGMPGRLRDVRSAVEAKFKMREIRNYGVPTLSFAALYVYLNQEPLGLGLAAFNGSQITERGHIGLFQAKLEFPTANNAMRIPISISASNRTELLKESDVRAQIGISFNLDAMFGERR